MCGIVGFCSEKASTQKALPLVVEMLKNSNGRGHDAVGIAAVDPEGDWRRFAHPGFARDCCHIRNSEFRELADWAQLSGARMWIGHTRYSTVGGNTRENMQPFRAETRFGRIYVAHNGQLVGHKEYKTLLAALHNFTSDSDSETLAAYIGQEDADTPEEAIANVIKSVPGVYSVVVLLKDRIIAARDRYGVRPLFIGKGKEGWGIASEPGILSGCTVTIEINPGAMVTLRPGFEPEIVQVMTHQRFECLLEAIYLTRPDRTFPLNGMPASKFREACGRQLAREVSITADIVCGVPASGLYAAHGFSQESGIDLELGAVLKNVFNGGGRSFIEAGQKSRDHVVRNKFTATPALLKGKHVGLVDDSVVRGTTTPGLVRMLKEQGARSVHLLVASPPVVGICEYGIDMPDPKNLIAYKRSVEEVRQRIGADSLNYLSLEGIEKVAANYSPGWCTGCFSGNYPIKS